MNCLPCFGSKETEINQQEDMPVAQTKGHPSSQSPVKNTTESTSAPASQAINQKQECAPTSESDESDEVVESTARNFGFREVAMATKNFRRECLLGESRFGKVYKGTLQGTGQVVAVKQLDKHGTKANKEFLAEVMMLSLLHHPNLAELIGYCADGDQRILLFEYFEMGSLNNHLHEVPPEKEPLDWITRMKIASKAAEALEYLHEKADPPVLYRNFKSTNIMLDENFEPKLTDYGLVKFEINSGNTMHQRIVSTVGCAPEYEQNGELTPKSDVYSFGIVLLELITGRKALDTTLPMDEQNLVTWAQPFFREPKRFPEMADPQLKGAFPDKSLNQAVGVAAMCVQDDPSVRPMISDIVAALSFLTMAPPPQSQPQSDPAPAPANATTHDENRLSSSSSSAGPEEELEGASSQDDGSEDISCSDYEYDDDDDDDNDDEQSSMRVKNNKTGGYGENRGGTSSSESLYNEDDYGEDESQQEEMGYRSKSKPKSIKRKVTFEREKRSVSRNSSKGNNKSFKTHSGSSLRKKSNVHRNPSENKKRLDAGLSKKFHQLFEDDQSSSDDTNESNNKMSSTHLNSSKKNVNREPSRNNERVDVSLSTKSHNVFEGDQSRSEPYESNNKISSTRSGTSSRREKGEKSYSSFSSDSGESNRRVVTFESTKKNSTESDSSMKNEDVEIMDGGEELNARLFEDTYVPI